MEIRAFLAANFGSASAHELRRRFGLSAAEVLEIPGTYESLYHERGEDRTYIHLIEKPKAPRVCSSRHSAWPLMPTLCTHGLGILNR